jgi:5-hydroxyisourate hydrolase-like protein (transthyretin family)
LHDKGCAEVDWYATYDGHVRGRVTDADGHPVPHLSMDLRRQDGDLHSTLHYKTTDEDGRYDFDAVEPGEYFVIANSMGVSPDRPYPKVFYPGAVAAGEVTPVKIGPSASVDSIDLVMPRPWKKITVKTKVIEADGSPAAGVSVYGYDRGYRSSMEPMTAKTDADGTATLPLYENHEYFITATKTGGTQQRCAGPLKIVAQDGLDTGILRIEHPWGNCLAQLNPNFRAPH